MSDYKIKPANTGWNVYVREFWYFIPYWKRVSLAPVPLCNACSLIGFHMKAEAEARAKYNRIK